MKRLTSAADLQALAERVQRELAEHDKKIQIKVHLGTCGIASGANGVLEALKHEMETRKLSDCVILRASCIGLCDREPMVSVILPGQKPVRYFNVTEDKAPVIVEEHIVKSKACTEWAVDENAPWFKLQHLRIMRDQDIDPASIDEYISRDGYRGLAKALTEMKPEDVLEEIKQSGVRGRGGAGFPAGTKWTFVRNAVGDEKFVLCNGDEGDPGAYMNRAVLEGNPHSVIEGMTLGAYAIGNVRQGYAYIRAEYPLAVNTLQNAIEQARDYGLLGDNILGTGFSFDIEIFPGAGAFVCGEETALMRSIEGKRGNPTQRPPFPANKGLFDKPTSLNNVETWSNIPQIVWKGADWFSSVGNERNKGTKTLCLVGKTANTGLVEVPLGITLKELVFDIGGGIGEGKKFKAVQLGGPSGGVIPARHDDTPIDYEAVPALGAIMGSGGVITLDEDDCMVDIAKFFLGFTQDESCGKCTPCRSGIPEMLETLTRISQANGKLEDIDLLSELGKMVAEVSLCGLGQTAPNPALTTIRHFREEYEAHIIDKRCPAGVCKALVAFHAIEDRCYPCLESVAGFDAGGFENLKSLLPELIPDRVMATLGNGACAVDFTRFLITVPAQNKECTKCPTCRLGNAHMVKLLEDIATGNGSRETLDVIVALGDVMKTGSECPVGKSAPDVVMFALEHFRDQFEAHIANRACPKGICRKTVPYSDICLLRAGAPIQTR